MSGEEEMDIGNVRRRCWGQGKTSCNYRTGMCRCVVASGVCNPTSYSSSVHDTWGNTRRRNFPVSSFLFNRNFSTLSCLDTLNVSASLSWEHRTVFRLGVQTLTPLKSLLISRRSPRRNTMPVCAIMISVCLFLLQQALSFCCSDIPYAAYRNISQVQTVL